MKWATKNYPQSSHQFNRLFHLVMILISLRSFDLFVWVALFQKVVIFLVDWDRKQKRGVHHVLNDFVHVLVVYHYFQQVDFLLPRLVFIQALTQIFLFHFFLIYLFHPQLFVLLLLALVVLDLLTILSLFLTMLVKKAPPSHHYKFSKEFLLS